MTLDSYATINVSTTVCHTYTVDSQGNICEYNLSNPSSPSTANIIGAKLAQASSIVQALAYSGSSGNTIIIVFFLDGSSNLCDYIYNGSYWFVGGLGSRRFGVQPGTALQYAVAVNEKLRLGFYAAGGALQEVQNGAGSSGPQSDWQLATAIVPVN